MNACLTVLSAAVCMIVSATGPHAAGQPNVIVILSDDQGWGDLSCHGNSNLSTPRLDSLARHGASFDRFYVCPVCSPTRAEFLTGRYHPRGGVRGVSEGGERLDLDETTIADSFRAAGYATAAIGKWHNGSQGPYHPLARGFDEFYGFTSGHWGVYFDPPLERNGMPVRGKGFIADDFTDQALDFLDRHRGKPFFCHLAFNTPHSPFCVPEEDWQRFRERPLKLRGRGKKEEAPDVTRCALAMVENLDRNVGRVLDFLDRSGLADNTIVVFFSDNGPNSPRWNGGLKGIKGSTDEGGVRSPLFVRWPAAIRPGTRIAPPAAAIDLLPTLAGLARVPRVGALPLDGIDFSALLTGTGVTAPPERFLFSHWGGHSSVRDQRFLLDSKGALFDLAADPLQQRDVADGFPDVVSRMRKLLGEWKEDVGLVTAPKPDSRPFPVGHPRLPVTPLPARDGVPHGGIRRSAPAPNCSYFTNWNSPDGSITWTIEVLEAGVYEATLLYTCAAADAGSTVELSFRDRKLTGIVQPAWDPPLLAPHDRIPRKAESQMKEFRPLPLGRMKLDAGSGILSLRATRVTGSSVMDLLGIEWKRIP